MVFVGPPLYEPQILLVRWLVFGTSIAPRNTLLVLALLGRLSAWFSSALLLSSVGLPCQILAPSMSFGQEPKHYPDYERRATHKFHPLQIAVISRQLRLPIKDVQRHQRVQTAICTGRQLFILVSLNMRYVRIDGNSHGEHDA